MKKALLRVIKRGPHAGIGTKIPCKPWYPRLDHGKFRFGKSFRIRQTFQRVYKPARGKESANSFANHSAKIRELNVAQGAD